MIKSFRPKGKSLPKKLIAIVSVFIAIAILASASIFGHMRNPNNYIGLEGFSRIESINADMEPPAVYLVKGCDALFFPITEDQAFSINVGLSGGWYRPLTHDLLKTITDHYDIEFVSSRITGEVDGVFVAKITVRQGNKVLDMDARPSDAAAISARGNIPLYVNDSLFNEKVC